jgi:tellurite methyltransferase
LSAPIRSEKATIDDAYYQATLDKPLHDVYRILEPHLPKSGIAVDLGCGVGTATLFLAEMGLEVYAIDLQPQAVAILRSRLPAGANVHAEVADMATWEIPACEVVVAGFSLFFLNQEQLEALWPRLVKSIRPGGLFSGQFLGPNDEWAGKGHALVDGASLRSMLAEFDLIHYDEVDREGQTALGNAKHWHVFHVVARKR